MRRNFTFIFLIISLGFGFLFGFLVGKSSVVCPICPPENVDFSILWETWKKLEENYVAPKALDAQKMIYGAVSGMIKSLEDPYTIFFNPEEAKTFLEDVSGRFEGVGMEIGIKKGQLQVIAPLEETPAQKAGLRAGDKILKIDDNSTVDLSTEKAVSLIRGPKGTKVTLTILRENWQEPKDFIIFRDIINVPSLKWELKDENIIYIKLYHFSEKVDWDFKEAAYEILNSPAKKIILDLRNNPGGYLERAQDIAGWFLEKGQIVVIEDFGEKKEQIIYRSEGNSKFSNYPLVILINQGSASAAEILASALRDNRGIKIIGETSFGKGSVQQLENLKDGSSLKITVANWLTPKGDLITDKGLEPDIKVEMTEEDYEQDKDPQLDKALEIIKGME
ncbi:MAG: hypothetical protein COU42_00065 [Candidatus Nealsonbacteria bacterium CG10_big_fil_rev_8_21_14_0_10_36_24]|uniref:PDZ domain-containing protein n=1 Tax=Candidatus Nealsonbacteria bacterium CG10_big_fil_rev_8_21_14_0_10_36_24 TaxID=1974710 RepID=A0A2M6NTL5_9BACT|nr:MAG: hypothetical protein COU42_00065 [Candidatus Nealsonbacteria bacterium CG10_big_fil_rev_8_21_14_0_10_36_24]